MAGLPKTHAVLHKTDGELAAALGVSKGWMSKLKRREWFPAKGPDGWDEPEVRAACELEGVPLTKDPAYADAPPGGGSSIATSSRTTSRRDAYPIDDPEQLEALVSSQDPTAVADAAARLAAIHLAQRYKEGTVTARDTDALKKALEELRRTREGHLKLQRSLGEVIDRAVALEQAASLARRFVQALDDMANDVAVQVELWTADQDFAAKNTEDRRREVRGWARRFGQDLRSSTATEIDARIEALMATG